MEFSEPVREVRFGFYHLDTLNKFDWQTWQDLQGYHIGAVTGYNIGDDWKKAIVDFGLKVEEVKTDKFNIDKLLLGRLDLVLTDFEVMDRIIEENPEYRNRVSRHPKPVFASVNNLGISKKSFLAPKLGEINRTLRQMKDDGAFQRIFCAHNKSYQGSCD